MLSVLAAAVLCLVGLAVLPAAIRGAREANVAEGVRLAALAATWIFGVLLIFGGVAGFVLFIVDKGGDDYRALPVGGAATVVSLVGLWLSSWAKRTWRGVPELPAPVTPTPAAETPGCEPEQKAHVVEEEINTKRPPAEKPPGVGEPFFDCQKCGRTYWVEWGRLCGKRLTVLCRGCGHIFHVTDRGVEL